MPFLWDLDRKKLWLYSQSSGALESFLLLFSETFDVGIDTPKLPDEQFRRGCSDRAALNADFGGFCRGSSGRRFCWLERRPASRWTATSMRRGARSPKLLGARAADRVHGRGPRPTQPR